MEERFACFADLHGLRPMRPEGDIKAWLIAGDLYSNSEIGRPTTPQRTLAHDGLRQWANGVKEPVCLVHGNHDCLDDYQLFRKFNNLSGDCLEISPRLWVVGLGWCGDMYYDLPRESDMAEIVQMARRAWTLKSKHGDQAILLTHYGPALPQFQTRGTYAGWLFDCVAKFLEEIKPLAILQGHIHQLAGQSFIHDAPTYRSFVACLGRTGGVLTIDKGKAYVNFKPLP